jgi:hypothetical protein
VAVCPNGWMNVSHKCYSPSVTGATGCTATDCDEVTAKCTSQGARLTTKDELTAWLAAGGSPSSAYGVTSSRSDDQKLHWLMRNTVSKPYGWHPWKCCDHPNRYHVCVKDLASWASRPTPTAPEPEPESPTWHLAPAGATACDSGANAPLHQCEAAVRQLARAVGKTPGRRLAYGGRRNARRGRCRRGGWGNVPRGCSAQSGGDWTAHYKQHVVNCASSDYRLVCSG